MSYLGANIKMIYKRWGLDQSEFAALMESTRGRVSQYVIGASEPKIPWMIRLQELSGIPIPDIYNRTLNKEDIPAEPITSFATKILSEPSSGYKPTKVNEELLHIPTLIKKIQELEDRVRELEG